MLWGSGWPRDGDEPVRASITATQVLEWACRSREVYASALLYVAGNNLVALMDAIDVAEAHAKRRERGRVSLEQVVAAAMTVLGYKPGERFFPEQISQWRRPDAGKKAKIVERMPQLLWDLQHMSGDVIDDFVVKCFGDYPVRPDRVRTSFRAGGIQGVYKDIHAPKSDPNNEYGTW